MTRGDKYEHREISIAQAAAKNQITLLNISWSCSPREGVQDRGHGLLAGHDRRCGHGGE